MKDFLLATICAVAITFIIAVNHSVAGQAEGKNIFTSKKCGGCHQTEGPASEKTFEDQLKKKGPELWYAGSKFKKDWLEQWMEQPTIIRLLKYNSGAEKNTEKHPTLSKGEAKEVAEYLMGLKAKGVAQGVIEENSTPQTKLLFSKKYGCVACHTMKAGARQVGGVSGPSLSEAGNRLTGDWVYAYLKEPKVFKPVKQMPIFAGIMNDADMKAIAGLVASQK